MIALAHPEFTMKRQQVALTAFVLSPLVVLVALCWMIAIYTKERNQNAMPAIGAGAGNTGGANAIGEELAHGRATSPNQPPAGGLVQPENLPQGFWLIVEDKSGKSSAASPIYLASNYNNWNPGDPQYKLEAQSDMKWRILVKRPAGRTDRLEFKFTRGTWELEELTAQLAPIKNRTLADLDPASVPVGEAPRIPLTVEHWGDERPEHAVRAAEDPYRTLTATGTVRRLQVRGGAGTAAGATRDLLVWLPPGYDDPKNAAAKYPVLYLHDGQNLFEKPATAPGEWMADETATQLMSKGLMSATIIVGIPHSGAGRISEYLPMPALEGVAPQGDQHVAWLLGEVMPRVERAFRVRTGPENTGIGGSSLGAAISLYAACSRPDVFGLVLAESLPLRTGHSQAWDDWLNSVKTWPRKVYLGMGGKETGSSDGKSADRNRSYVEAVQTLDRTLDKAGLGPDRRLLVVVPEATHTESAWAQRLPEALKFLFPPPMDSTK